MAHRSKDDPNRIILYNLGNGKRIEIHKPDEPTLRNLYHQEKLSLQEIADKYMTTATSVWRWLREHGIARRNLSTARQLLPPFGHLGFGPSRQQSIAQMQVSLSTPVRVLLFFGHLSFHPSGPQSVVQPHGGLLSSPVYPLPLFSPLVSHPSALELTYLRLALGNFPKGGNRKR